MPTTIQGVLLNLVYLGVLAGITAVAPKAIAWLRAHTTAQQRAVLSDLAAAAVPWAEKFFPALPGAQQFTEAVTQAQAWLKARGINITESEVQAEVQRAYAAAKVSGVLAAAKTAAPTSQAGQQAPTATAKG